MLQGLAGATTVRAGEVLHLDPATAKRYVEHEIAEFLEDATPSEKATEKKADAKKPSERSQKGTSRKARKSEKR